MKPGIDGDKKVVAPLYTVHCTLYTVHCTLYTVHCTLYTVRLHCTLYNAQCTEIKPDADLLGADVSPASPTTSFIGCFASPMGSPRSGNSTATTSHHHLFHYNHLTHGHHNVTTWYPYTMTSAGIQLACWVIVTQENGNGHTSGVGEILAR